MDTVPDTLLGVLSARIDRLPDKAKSLLQTASVIGREFSRRLLALVWEDDATLEPELARLTRLEFIYEQTSHSDVTYAFKHALTREAAYASLLSRRRRACHGAVGRALERLHAERIDEAVEFLAHQFGQSEDDEKAVDYAIRAAERAQSRWANTEALAFSDLALQRLKAMPPSDASRLRQIDVVIKQAEVRFALGQHTAQLAALASIASLVLPTDDAARRAAWHYWTGFLNSITGGRAEASIGHCQEASSIAKAAHLEDLSASADSCLAQVYVFAGELHRAIETGERALEVFERRGNRWWACRTLSQLSPAANALGQWQRSLAYCARAMEHGVADGRSASEGVGHDPPGVGTDPARRLARRARLLRAGADACAGSVRRGGAARDPRLRIGQGGSRAGGNGRTHGSSGLVRPSEPALHTGAVHHVARGRVRALRSHRTGDVVAPGRARHLH